MCPRQFDDTNNKTTEVIDVPWLQGDAIVEAFEVEQIGNRMRYMKPEFISEIAESCEPDYT